MSFTKKCSFLFMLIISYASVKGVFSLPSAVCSGDDYGKHLCAR